MSATSPQHIKNLATFEKLYVGQKLYRYYNGGDELGYVSSVAEYTVVSIPDIGYHPHGIDFMTVTIPVKSNDGYELKPYIDAIANGYHFTKLEAQEEMMEDIEIRLKLASGIVNDLQAKKNELQSTMNNNEE